MTTLTSSETTFNLGFKLNPEMIFRKSGCLVGSENWVKRKITSIDRKICPLILSKHFCFYFTFKSLPELRCAKRGAHRRAKGERERERTTHRRSGPTPDAAARLRRRVRAAEFSVRIADLSLSRSPSPFWTGSDCCSIAPIAISPSHRSQSQHRATWSRLRLRHAISLLIEPSRLSLFLLLSIWSDLMIFFLGFVCVFLLRNEWYYIFVWQLRKCEQQVENMFFMVFSRTQPNTRKYFSKDFLKCNQTLENNFISWK